MRDLSVAGILARCVAVSSLAIAMAPLALAIPVTDTIQYPTPEFENPSAPGTSYRWYNEDWGWQHNAMASGFTTATVSVSAWDVDASSGEVDNIYARDNGTWVLLGSLQGANNIWQWTTFTLTANFFDDIVNGLELWIDIDSTNTTQWWAVSLAKSTLSLDGATLPPPNPGNVPIPAAAWLFGGAMGVLMRLRKYARA